MPVVLTKTKAIEAGRWCFGCVCMLWQRWGFSFLPVMAGGSFSPVILVLGILGGVLLGQHLYRNYYQKAPQLVQTTYRDWVWLFFWAIITHPLLDSCTVFGTQLFQPFSDYRVGFNIISVADPIYSIPFFAVCDFGRLAIAPSSPAPLVQLGRYHH